MEFICVPEQCKLDKTIPRNKLFEKDFKYIHDVLAVRWSGSIKPQISGKEPVYTDKKRYEEIQVLEIILVTRENLYPIAREIYRTIKYPCVIEFHTDGATIIGANTFTKGVFDPDTNVHIGIFFSHWLHKEYISLTAERMIKQINEALDDNTEIEQTVKSIREAISSYALGGINRSHTERIIKDLLGYEAGAVRKRIKDVCVPYRFYPGITTWNKYNKANRGKGYRLIYDGEELWYAFMTCDSSKRIIEKRRYRDIDDLIYSIDSKLEDYKENETTHVRITKWF